MDYLLQNAFERFVNAQENNLKVNELEEILKSVGVSLRNKDGEFKTLYQVLEDLSVVYAERECTNKFKNMVDVKEINHD